MAAGNGLERFSAMGLQTVQVQSGSIVAQKLIFKILPGSVWKQAESEGVFCGVGIDLADGYIHFSTGEQLRETAQKHFAGQSDLVLFWVDADRLGEELKWEPSRGGALFPHLYRDLRIEEVIQTVALPMDEDGEFHFPALDSISKTG